MHDDLALFGGLDAATFRSEYWQRSPLRVPAALSDAGSLPDRDALVALAARPDANARVVVAPRGDAGWSLRSGPFPADEIAALPPDGWTLLVQEADRHLPACAALLERFRIAPNWRVDDVMVSYAADGGGVGPHLDRYDVFLVQAHGRRRWRIETAPRTRPPRSGDTPLPLLDDFSPDEEWTLEPGDLLYLPPRIAHEGVAEGPCVTCSVGFRVPDPRELYAGFLRQLSPDVLETARYRDPVDASARDERVGEISAEARDCLRAAGRELFDDENGFDRWLGRMVTAPLRGEPAGVGPGSVALLWESLDRGASLRRSSPAHFAWFREDDGEVQLFVGGERYPLGEDAGASAELLCGRRRLTADAALALAEDEGCAGVLLDLVRRGYLTLVPPRESG